MSPRNPKSKFWPTGRGSTASHDADNFQTIFVIQCTARELRRRDSFAIVFHHDTAREKVLRAQKFLKRAGQLNGNTLAVGGDSSSRHQVKVSKLTSGGQLMRIP